jgi:hypothetical protein
MSQSTVSSQVYIDTLLQQISLAYNDAWGFDTLSDDLGPHPLLQQRGDWFRSHTQRYGAWSLESDTYLCPERYQDIPVPSLPCSIMPRYVPKLTPRQLLTSMARC